MPTCHLTSFDTKIGACGIAWGERGVRGLQLPEAGATATMARLRRRFPGADECPPSAEVARAIAGIRSLLAGEAADLAGIVLDLAPVPPFERAVYAIARTIAPGATLTYGEIAARLDPPGDARDVGQALGRNPFPLVVPCHRVVAAGGKLGGFSAHGGVATKRRLLAIESALPSGTPDLFSVAAEAAAGRG